MSGVAGLIHFDGAPVQAGAVERMTAAMAHRGPDGRSHWHRDPASLGQCLFRTTPESREETLPWTDEHGRFALVMDGRVDNREQLRHDLLGRGTLLRNASDAELVLRAYEAWGEQSPLHVIGELVFLVWDSRDRTLFAARDAAGTRHFYYQAGAHGFAFASEIKGLLALDAIPPRLHEPRFLQTLVLEFDREDPVGTCYRDILRLPAGHAMRVNAGGLATWRYWDPSGLAPMRFSSIDECAEALREQLRVAVHSRMRLVGGVGAALSGGLDSSSVACLALERLDSRLQGFSLVREDRKACPEWRHVDRLARDGRIEVRTIQPGIARERWRHHLDAICAMDEPFAFNNGYTDLLVCEAARQAGCRVLLDGMAGDLLFYWFDQSLSFDREGRAAMPGLAAAALRHRVPGVTRMLAMRTLAAAAPAAFKRWYRRSRAPYLPADARLLRQTLAQDLVARYRDRPAPAATDQEHHARLFTCGLLPAAHEGYGQIAFAHGIETRSPFSDRRVIEFAIRMPRSAKICSSWYKLALRKAMAGLLPEEVRWRRDVTMHPGSEFRARFVDEISRGAPGVWNPHVIGHRMKRWVDPENLLRAWRSHERTRDVHEGYNLLTLAATSHWFGSRPRLLIEGA